MKHLCNLLLFWLSAHIIVAQGFDCDSIGIAGPLNFVTELVPADTICNGESACIEITTENFNDIIGFQYTLVYDPEVIEIIGLSQMPGRLVGSISFNNSNDGYLATIWTNSNSTGQTILDGVSIYVICFTVIGEANNDVKFSIENNNNVYPSSEVNYLTEDGESCSSDSLLLNSSDHVSYKTCCPEFSITNVTSCEEAGILSFRNCGGSLPYQASLTDDQNIVLHTTTINSDEDVTIWDNIYQGEYTIELTDASNNTIKEIITISDNEATVLTTYYRDNDLDGYGHLVDRIGSCFQPDGYVINNEDCNDDDPSINPDAIEICDGIDNNCDSSTDEGFDPMIFYYDLDDDGYGDPDNTVITCETLSNITTDNTDCDDTNPDINPGAMEILGNGIDDNCDGRDNTTSTENDYNPSHSIFPNPAYSNIQIHGRAFSKAILYNTYGQSVIETAQTTIDISVLSRGLYLIHLYDDKRSLISTHRIIKL